MKILALDTSGPVCGVAVLADHKVLFEACIQNGRNHSVSLMPLVDQACAVSGIQLNELDRLAVVEGPGSFTGVRIGISTAKGLAHGANLTCVAVDALEALAMGVSAYDAGLICPIQDARGGQVYAALFASDGEKLSRRMEDRPIAVSELCALLKEEKSPVLFVGDGMPVHRAAIDEALGDQAKFAPPHLCYLRPSAVAVLAERAERLQDYQSLMPLYLRAPSAERNKQLMEAMHA